MADKKGDLAGPGIGDYKELEKALPQTYVSLLSPRETLNAIFITGIGWPPAAGYHHGMRAADYDDWISDTVSGTGKTMYGLNGDILVWNPVTKQHHELTSMGIRVSRDTLTKQLERSGQLDFLKQHYHQVIMRMTISHSVNG